MPAFVLAILKSRTASAIMAVAVVLLALFTWHKLDRSSAVRRAVAEYVASVELHEAKKELAEMQRRKAIVEKANARLRDEIDAVALAAEMELESYVSTVDQNCTVGRALFERLRNR